MRRFAASAAIALTVAIFSFSIVAPVAFAATQPSANNAGQALEIAPPLITLNVNPGQTVKTQIKLRDVSKAPVVVTEQLNDFVASGESGTPQILTNGDDSNNPYTVQGWISQFPTLTLKPQQLQTFDVTLNVPKDAAPGGHYGIIRFTGSSANPNDNGVALSTSLGVLLLITVSGQIKDSLSIAEFSVNKDGKAGSFFESAPLNFVEKIKNTGNVHEEPTGVITIKDMFGRTTAGVPVNNPPRNVLPSSTRKFTQALDSSVIGSKHLFGHYSATLNLTYGTSKKTTTAKVAFWVIPYRLILVIIVLLVGGFFALRILLRRYNRHIIERSRRGSGGRR